MDHVVLGGVKRDNVEPETSGVGPEEDPLAAPEMTSIESFPAKSPPTGDGPGGPEERPCQSNTGQELR